MLSILILFIIGYIIYQKRCMSDICQHDHAIILGGSISGIATAGYITNIFKKLQLLNQMMYSMSCTSDELLTYPCHLESPTSLGRSGVLQIYQLHVIEGEGYKI